MTTFVRRYKWTIATAIAVPAVITTTVLVAGKPWWESAGLATAYFALIFWRAASKRGAS